MKNQLDYILSTQAVRERSQLLFDLNVQGQGHFTYHPEKWDEVVEFVYQTILENYPKLDIPFHSRLGHFRPGGVNRLDWLWEKMGSLTSQEKVKLLIDLIIPSVLLDAGAGDAWSFNEERTGQTITRSEGLGVASFYLFFNQTLSTQKNIQTDSEGLLKLTKSQLEAAFQVTEKNPLVGVEGRLHLLHALGGVMKANPNVFPNGRPSDLLPLMLQEENVSAPNVLTALLTKLGGIWPSRLNLEGMPLGDTWSHPALGTKDSFESLVPFHKLSQWLSYSILDAFLLCDFKVVGVEKLTGLPEYRNGGLFLDLELITAKDKNFLTKGVSAEEPFTIEWRAMTIILLDILGEKIQKKLGKSPQDFPLAKVLEGGSWWAGRRIAKIKRPGGTPPLNIKSDGTVF